MPPLARAVLTCGSASVASMFLPSTCAIGAETGTASTSAATSSDVTDPSGNNEIRPSCTENTCSTTNPSQNVGTAPNSGGIARSTDRTGAQVVASAVTDTANSTANPVAVAASFRVSPITPPIRSVTA